MTKWVYDFAEGSREMRDLLGGKGANIAEMKRIGGPVRVPDGFTSAAGSAASFASGSGAGSSATAKPVAAKSITHVRINRMCGRFEGRRRLVKAPLSNDRAPEILGAINPAAVATR